MSSLIFLLAYDLSKDKFTVEDVLPDDQPFEAADTSSSRITQDRNNRKPPISCFCGPCKHESLPEQVVPSHRPFTFYHLPLELRRAVYIHVLGSSAPAKTPFDVHPYHRQRGPLHLLLISRQIYCEARLIPFQHNTFEFVKWNGTGLMYCDRFLRSLRPWQRRQVRNIVLDVLAVSLDNGGHLQNWLDVCNKLSCGQTGDTGGNEGEYTHLRSLKLTINGCFTKNGRVTFNSEARWVVDGLLKLTSLRLFEITVVTTETIDKVAVANFIADLRRKLSVVEIISRMVEKGKERTLYIPIDYAAAACY